MAAALFVTYLVVALARVERLEAGTSLARYVQALWFLADGKVPELTIGVDGNLLADRLPLVMWPVGALSRIVPATGLLLSLQAASLALGAVPLWRLARRVANLRVGATAAIVAAYGAHPAVADLALADFQPATLATGPLLAAAYFAERRRWRWFTVCCLGAMACASELGLVVATFGIVLMLDGERTVGARAAVGGFMWTLTAVVVQQQVGDGGLVAPGAFDGYGDGALGVLIDMVRNPFTPLGDLVRERNVELLVWVLAPMLFLPVLALRKLLPALPLTVLYLIADVQSRGPSGGGRTVPLLCFGFVALTFALARLGRPSSHRVLIDRRILLALLAASAAYLVTASPVTPYDRPWSRTREPADEDLRAAAAAVSDDEAVRAPPRALPLLADRARVEVLGSGPLRVDNAVVGVDAVIVDTAQLARPDDVHPPSLRRAFGARGFMVRLEADAVYVFAPPEEPEAVPTEP
jgi:uncharacterized membrane protein